MSPLPVVIGAGLPCLTVQFADATSNPERLETHRSVEGRHTVSRLGLSVWARFLGDRGSEDGADRVLVAGVDDQPGEEEEGKDDPNEGFGRYLDR